MNFSLFSFYSFAIFCLSYDYLYILLSRSISLTVIYSSGPFFFLSYYFRWANFFLLNGFTPFGCSSKPITNRVSFLSFFCSFSIINCLLLVIILLLSAFKLNLKSGDICSSESFFCCFSSKSLAFKDLKF